MIKKAVTAIAILAVVTILGTGWWLFSTHEITSPSVYVEPGDPFYRVVRKLKDAGAIRASWIFSRVGIVAGLEHRVAPGRYDFDRYVSNFDVLYKLWRADIVFVNVTIPEGYTLKQIEALLSRQCGTAESAFDSLVRDSQYLAGLGITAGFAEGYLFPETYRFRWGISAAEAVETMVGELFSGLDSSLTARCRAIGLSLHQILTMASIVEREGVVHDEYPTIASVYFNRYRIGMRLQADPTVIYGMGGLDRALMTSDYQYPSKYNTYLHKGLPPTPICSPGMQAIRATLYPDSTDYLYFVADGTGRHIFNASYQQHLLDVRRIRYQKRLLDK